MADSREKKRVSRRSFIGSVGVLGAGLAFTGGGWAASNQAGTNLSNQLSNDRAELDRVSSQLRGARDQLEVVLKQQWIAFGGGTNVKMMSNPVTGEPTVRMDEVFHFDLKSAFCRVDNVPESFILSTAHLGEVQIDANSFFMVMIAEEIGVIGFTADEGVSKIKLSGQLGCRTAAHSAGAKIGDRQVVEPARYEIIAVDDEVNGNRFEFITFFHPDTAPVNNAIFGDRFVFTGDIDNGHVTILPIQRSEVVTLGRQPTF